MFLIYIRDLGQDEHGSSSDGMNILKYVDDTKAFQAIFSLDDIETFQSDLEMLYEWAGRNAMRFNGDKFHVMKYGKNEEVRNETYLFTPDMGSPIDMTQSTCDLGVLTDEDMSWRQQRQQAVAKMNQEARGVLFAPGKLP